MADPKPLTRAERKDFAASIDFAMKATVERYREAGRLGARKATLLVPAWLQERYAAAGGDLQADADDLARAYGFLGAKIETPRGR